MNAELKIALITIALGSAVLLVLAHILYVRWVWRKRRRGQSPQKALFAVIFALNFPVVGAVLFVVHGTGISHGEMIASVLYVAALYNASGYAYFHFFNLSETGRRIRMLEMLANGESYTEGSEAQQYSAEAMVRIRLDRLVNMGEITMSEHGEYRLRRKTMLAGAYLLGALRDILMGRNKVA